MLVESTPRPILGFFFSNSGASLFLHTRINDLEASLNTSGPSYSFAGQMLLGDNIGNLRFLVLRLFIQSEMKTWEHLAKSKHAVLISLD